MRKALITATVAALAAAGFLVTPGGAADSQFTFFSNDVVHIRNKHAPLTTLGQSNWVSPVNYAGGRVYMRLDVTEKPTTKKVGVQLCAWRLNYVEETCSSKGWVERTGVHWVDFGAPSGWWKKNNLWSWATVWSPTHIMWTDAVSGKLMMDGACGANCYTGTDLANHLPIKANAWAIVVPAGGSLVPPAEWRGCPEAWSASCPNPGGTTTGGSTTTTNSTTSATTTAAPGSRQFDFIDQPATFTGTAHPVVTGSGPASWVSPVNYANGRVLVRLGVIDKPSRRAVQVSTCVIRGTRSACSPRTRIRTEGTKWVDLGSPAAWTKTGAYSWSQAPTTTRVLLHDAASGRLLMSAECGTQCFTGTGLGSHVPITLDVHQIVVAPGAAFTAPDDWDGCPAAWGGGC